MLVQDDAGAAPLQKCAAGRPPAGRCWGGASPKMCSQYVAGRMMLGRRFTGDGLPLPDAGAAPHLNYVAGHNAGAHNTGTLPKRMLGRRFLWPKE
eukprot:gene11140-biopygen4093